MKPLVSIDANSLGTWARVAAAMFLAALAGCSGDDNNQAGGGGAGGSDGGSNGGGGTPESDGGFSLKTFAPPNVNMTSGILFTASGEALAQTGYDFPPASADAAQFYDGWDIKFDRLLVTFDKITLSANPDTDPGDQSKTGGLVAQVNGPWAVDLHRDDPSYLDGKSGGGERAIPIAALTTQSNGSAFATDGTRYAFGFDAVVATSNAQNVNLDTAALADYQAMTASGCAVLYVGTATFRGDKTDAACYPTDHHGWPDTVKFKLCFKTPTTYINCQNPDNSGMPVSPDEEAQRGIAFDAHSAVIGQVTFHTDHPFWDSVLHDSPAHFDQFAARVIGLDAGIPTVTLETTKGVDYLAYTDLQGQPVNWRYCSAPPTDVHPPFTGRMAFDPHGIPHSTDPATGLRDYYDFATYNQSTQGHLNADGLCFVQRNYPSPP
jgi:hypothetical protein